MKKIFLLICLVTCLMWLEGCATSKVRSLNQCPNKPVVDLVDNLEKVVWGVKVLCW